MPQRLNKEGTKWRVQVRAGDQRPSEIVHGDWREAEQREAELKAKFGRLKLKRTPETVGEYLTTWLEATQRNAIGDQTYERYDTNIRCQLIPVVGHIALTRLTSADIIAGYQRLADGEGVGKCGPATIRKAHNVLRAAMDDAVDDGKLKANPASARRIAKWLRGYTRATPKADMSPPPLRDVQSLLQRMLTTDSGRRLYGPCLLMLDTGMRRQEVLALKWSDIDLELGVVRVTRAVVQTSRHGVIIKDTKTEHGERDHLLTERSRQYLIAHKADQERMAENLADRWAGEDWVFPNIAAHKGLPFGRLWMPTTFSMLLARESERLGMPLEPHQLRRLNATIKEHAGWPQTETAASLGHGDTTVTKKHYLFAVQDGQRERMDKFEAALTELAE